MSCIFRWTRLISSKWEDSWLERLRGVGKANAVITALPGSRTERVEVYCNRREAQKLVDCFGGRASALETSQWKAGLEKVLKPISIRGRLMIYGNEASFASHTTRTTPLFFPAEMAFGSGSHASTASCLRILCDLQPSLGRGWKMLDLGTGSGILAIAARALGADSVLAVDFDPIAIRVARCNWRRNRASAKGKGAPHFGRVDLRESFPQGKYHIICANLFSELLIELASRIFCSLESGGWWVFSGVLTHQMPEVALAIRKAGFSPPITKCRGKWVAGIVQKPN